MPGVEHLGLFVLAGLLLNLTPGPDVLFIVTHGLRHGTRCGMVAALGITAGCFVHIAAAALGVGALLAASSTAFNLLKWAGAAYLLYMGWNLLRKPGDLPGLMASASAPVELAPAAWAVFLRGFWTNVLNPKVALFFLAFVPQFIAPDAAQPALLFLLLGLVFSVNGLFVNLGWAWAAATLARHVKAVRHSLRWLDRAAGALFIGFGLRLALADNMSR
jgi:threonine/homoserine/homoserine lactone efflux protein